MIEAICYIAICILVLGAASACLASCILSSIISQQEESGEEW